MCLAPGDDAMPSAEREFADRASMFRDPIPLLADRFLGTLADREPILMLGTAIFAVGEDGLLRHNWVERNACELHRRLVNAD